MYPGIIPGGTLVSMTETEPSSEAESTTSGENGCAERQYIAGISSFVCCSRHFVLQEGQRSSHDKVYIPIWCTPVHSHTVHTCTFPYGAHLYIPIWCTPVHFHMVHTCTFPYDAHLYILIRQAYCWLHIYYIM